VKTAPAGSRQRLRHHLTSSREVYRGFQELVSNFILQRKLSELRRLSRRRGKGAMRGKRQHRSLKN